MTKTKTTAIDKFKDIDQFKNFLWKKYERQVSAFFGDEQKAKDFLAHAVTSISSNPALLQCTAPSLIDSFMKMASFKFMPSDVSGEAYVIPRKIKGILTAKFQVGYQGWITLMYRAGVTAVGALILREKDKFAIKDDIFTYEIDPRKSEEERGSIVGVYAYAIYKGEKSWTYMHIDDVIKHAAKYAPSFQDEKSAWHTSPEWMYKKTVLIQLAKTLPKSKEMRKALEYDYEGDSTITRKPIDVIDLDELKETSNLTLNAYDKNKDKKDKENNEELPNPFAKGGDTQKEQEKAK